MDHLTHPSERTPKAELEILFRRQKAFAPKVALSSPEARRDKLKRMLDYIVRNASEIESAAYSDLRKPTLEARLSEVLQLTTEIRYHLKHLKRWMKPQRVSTPLLAVGTHGYIQYEPKGTALIISPWNYPISLAIKPLIAAVSAGCTAILKPSEYAPHSCAIIKNLVKNVFNPEEVAVVEGGKTVSTDLLELPFDHIFFTGSPAVGKSVMKAAAAHLASVTLELGGKSPCIVDESADIPSAAEQIVWAKFLNNGQTCIAPDYILVDQKIEERLLRALTQALKERYPAVDNGLQQSPDYGRVIHAQHFEKLRSQFDDALAKGAVVISGGTFDREDLYIAPTILSKVDDRMALMEDEIFGPLLPVIPFDSIDESIRFINGKEKPLAMYVYTRKSKNAEYILARTSSGNALVNEMLTQFQHPEIPFGGIGNSGTGKTNGFFGFQEFSNAKGVIKRQFGSFKVVYPPFSTLKQKLVTLLTKYL